MSGILSTALTGFFLLSAATGTLTESVLQAPEDTTSKIEIRSSSRTVSDGTPKPRPIATHTVAMTGYNAVPEQTDSDPFTTASGAYSNPEIMAARSVDLKDELPFGTIIEIKSVNPKDKGCAYEFAEPFVGYRVIGDSMHPRKRQQIDILFDSEIQVKTGSRYLNPAVAMGYCKEVEINVVGFVSIKEIPQTQSELKARIGQGVFSLNK
jgi:3D (Asp-Asp-Asp) domain-containing protein